MTSVAAVKGIEKLSASDLKALKQSADAIGIPVDWLATVISFETAGTFSPSIKNAAGSGATGLIQFMPKTAAGLLGGTPDEAIKRVAAMSFKEQLKLVEKYFAPYKGKLKSLDDVYLVVFYPAAVGKPADWVVAPAGTKVYEQNRVFDVNNSADITKTEITATIRKVLAAAANKPHITIPAAISFTAVAMVGLTALAGWQALDMARRIKA